MAKAGIVIRDRNMKKHQDYVRTYVGTALGCLRETSYIVYVCRGINERKSCGMRAQTSMGQCDIYRTRSNSYQGSSLSPACLHGYMLHRPHVYHTYYTCTI